ncbi:hypothetical protein [Actinophytocola oryzae]|uniref:Uncharacterized protein n=1 Tax=Actinophytocola oryzae TaxID=502181 RepID=A0A4R7UW33_9PSEU|nr:hypothetical protein [Actinophytocola oryzae]TDV40983.1 hypothetical protein CLV71_12149 [Actinophytocola oryzae]
MFASVLREVTGYLDRRMLVSTFFPVLAFMGGTVLVVSMTVAGVSGAVARWGRLPGMAQTVLIAGFLVLAAFLTFLVGNLREWQDRVCQGYWPSWADRVRVPLLRRQERARQTLVEQDEVLRRREERLAGERDAFPRPAEVTPHALPSNEIDAELAALEGLTDDPEWTAGTSVRLTELAKALHGEETGRAERFTTLWFALDTRLAAAEQQVREERASVQRRLFVLYPQPPRGVSPTTMGNVVLAAEQHSAVRYRLDAVVMWTRLRPLLPNDFAEALKDARVSVDLLLTVAVFLPLFGAPLSWWLAFHLPSVTGTPAAWLTYLAVVLCGLVLCGEFRRTRDRLIVAGSAVAVVLLSLWSPALRLSICVLWPLGLLVVSYGLYRNATHAMLAYTERLRTAFDLYRWKVLEELRIDLPKTLEEERGTWQSVTQFLYRGGTVAPDRLHYDHPVRVPD